MDAEQLQARVHGAGPTGAVTAFGLAAAGWHVDLHDRLEPAQLRQRQRAYALTHSSRRLLEHLDLWESLEPLAAPFRGLELRDGALHRRVGFSTADLGDRRAAEPGAAVGWVLQHGPLMDVLLERLEQHPRVRLVLGAGAGADGDDAMAASLVVAADGAGSVSRQAAGLPFWSTTYHQACLTVQVRLRGAEPEVAWELFRPEGPFAVLPLGGDAYQLVWSAPSPQLRRLESLDPVLFLEQLAGVLPEQLQPEVLLDQPRAFPVALAIAPRMGRDGLVLVGDSAHRCHPVGGQGLNLCWRDVAVLERLARQVAAGRRPPAALAAAYGRRRWIDVVLTLLTTHLLVSLFSTRLAPALGLRWLAMAALNRWAPLRRLCLGAMTDGPCHLGSG